MARKSAPGDALSSRGLLEAIRVSAVSGVPMPMEVRAAFLRGYGLLAGAHVGTLDEAFGRYWPKGTHLAAERDRQRLPPLVNRYVFQAIQADSSRAIDRILFTEIGERPDVAKSGSVVEEHYYAGLAAGLVNVQALRDREGALPRNSGEFSGEQVEPSAPQSFSPATQDERLWT